MLRCAQVRVGFLRATSTIVPPMLSVIDKHNQLIDAIFQ